MGRSPFRRRVPPVRAIRPTRRTRSHPGRAQAQSQAGWHHLLGGRRRRRRQRLVRLIGPDRTRGRRWSPTPSRTRRPPDRAPSATAVELVAPRRARPVLRHTESREVASSFAPSWISSRSPPPASSVRYCFRMAELNPNTRSLAADLVHEIFDRPVVIDVRNVSPADERLSGQRHPSLRREFKQSGGTRFIPHESRDQVDHAPSP